MDAITVEKDVFGWLVGDWWFACAYMVVAQQFGAHLGSVGLGAHKGILGGDLFFFKGAILFFCPCLFRISQLNS